jgi:hypothetical protein
MGLLGRFFYPFQDGFWPATRTEKWMCFEPILTGLLQTSRSRFFPEKTQGSPNRNKSYPLRVAIFRRSAHGLSTAPARLVSQ